MTDKTYCMPDGTVLTMPAAAAQLLREFSAEVDRLRQQVADLHTEARQNADLRREVIQLEVNAENARLRALLPKPEVQRAIRLYANGLRPKNGEHWNAEIRAWLERLEANHE